MEDNIQTIIAVIIAAFLLFIFPVYMAYEKKDDISYALAMRYTQDLVDDVRSKGYITKDMYDSYMSKLKITGNTYDVQMTHEYNRYDPITNYYKIEGGKYTLVKTTTREESESDKAEKIQEGINRGDILANSSDAFIEEYIKSVYETEGIDKVEDTYKLSTEIYSTENIVGVLNSERKLQLNSTVDTIYCSDDDESDDGCQYAYVMNSGDNFNIVIKNTNITLATVVYNMVTANTLDTNTRIYVNYGGSILSTKWYGDIDYAKMKHDNINLTNTEEKVVFTDERYFDEGRDNSSLVENIPVSGNNSYKYVIEFEAKPEDVTELREKGNFQLADFSGYNFALGTNQVNPAEDRLSVSVGYNGISLLVSNNREVPGRTLDTKEYVLDKQYIYGSLRQATIHDIKKLKLYCEADALVAHIIGYDENVEYWEYKGISDEEDEELLMKWSGLNYTINTPTVSNRYVANGEYLYVIMLQETKITVSMQKIESKKQTILSYPTSINDYTKIKIEFAKQLSGKYIASLYVKNLKVAESIELDSIPKVDAVGMTIIGTEERYYSGYIRNVKIYETGD